MGTARRLLVALSLSCAPACAQEAPETVTLGVQRSLADAGVFIAQARGYFAAENLRVRFVQLETNARPIALLARNELDAAGMDISAALYNAVARNIDLRLVAVKTRTRPGRPALTLVVRADAMQAGRWRGPADLRGLVIAGPATGSPGSLTLARLAQRGGLADGDAQDLALAPGQMLAALAGRSLDAALLGEPSATEAVRVGLGVAVLGDDEIDPGRQHAGLVAAGAFAADRPHALRAFLRAYLRGVRDHEDAVQDGRFAGDKADAVVAILAAATYVKDAALLRALRPAPLDPDGAPDMARLKEDLALWRARGLIEGVVDAPLAVDASFIEDTLGRLGRYRR